MNSEPCQNTDKEIWREREGDYYADSIFVTERGMIGINCGGSCIVMPVREWHKIAGGDRMNLQQAQELSHKHTVPNKWASTCCL